MRVVKTTAICVLAATAASALAPEGVLLRRELKEGQEDVYQIEMRMEQSITMGDTGMGSMPIEMGGTMKMTLKTGKVDEEKGKADLEVLISDMNLDFQMMGQTPDMSQEMPDQYKMNGKIDVRNRLTEVKASGLSPEMSTMMDQMNSISFMFVEFPEKAVEIGDTWKVEMPGNMLTGGAAIKLTARLVGEKIHKGKPVYEIQMGGTIPIDTDLAKMFEGNPNIGQEMPDMKMLITGTMKVQAQVLVEKETGRTVYMENLTTNDQRMEMPGIGMTVDMQGAMKMTMSLQDA